MRRRPLALAAAAVVGGLLLSPATAAATTTVGSPGASIGYVERTDEGLQVLVNVPADAEVDYDDVAVTVDGAASEASAVPAESTTSVRRTAVLVMDTSNSMAGDRFDAARAAASTFLDTVPDDVHVGIVTFDSDVSQELAPSLDRDAARTVIDGLELSRETRLYEGVEQGLAMVGTDGQRQLLVLSDGADTSTTDLGETTQAVADSGATVNVVGLEQTGRAVSALEEIVAAGEGSLVQADSEALEQAFSAQADVLARQVLVTAPVPAGVTSRDATVAVTLGSDVGDLTAEAFARLGQPDAGSTASTPALSAVEPPMVLNTWWLYGGLGGLALGLVVLLVVALVPRRAKSLTADELALNYTRHVAGGAHRADSQGLQAGQVTETAEKVLGANKNLESRIASRLDGAGNPFKPAEWVLVHLTVFLGSGALGMLLGAGSIPLGILFLVLGAVGPWMFLGFKRGRRRKAFERSLPDTLQLMSGSLAAGLSLAQSVDTIVREGQEPISTEFRRVLVETRLGINLDDALEGVAERFQSKDFSWVVMAIRIQRQVGGNLAELLDTVAATMREREYMRRQVAALAAEGKLSAYVLGALPPGFMGFLLLTKGDYVKPMFTEPMGLIMLAGAGLLLGVGGFWMSRLVKVEV